MGADQCEREEEILQHIIDLLPTRIFWKDLDLKFLGCNKVFAKDAGKSSSKDMIGKTDLQMPWKKEGEAYRKDDQEVIDSRKAKVNFEEPQTTPDGNEIWLRTSKVPLTDKKGKVIGILGMYDDITAIKHAEIELKEGEKLLNEVGDIAKIGGWEMDLVTRKAKWTKATYDIVGIPYDDPIPGPDEHVRYYYRDDQEKVEKAMEDLVKRGKPLNFEARLDFKGQCKWVHALGNCIMDGKKCIKIRGTLQDITKYKEEEEAIAERTKDVERFNKMAIGREIKMAELKKDIRELKRKLGE